MRIDSFHKIAKNYKVIFFDSFGVLRNYNGIIPGAQNTFNELLTQGIDYFILTNDASRSPEMLAQSYFDKGFKHIPGDKIISSGMLAREFLRNKISKGKIVYLGTKNSAVYIEKIGFELINVEDIVFTNEELNQIQALVLLDDEGYAWRKGMNNMVNLLRLRNIPVVVANTDFIYPVSDHDIAIATGGIAYLVEKIVGKHFIRFGKPDVQIFSYAFEHINAGQDTYKKSDILMVGDTLTTDIIGANKFGIDTALVLTGNTIPDQADFLIKSSGIIPDYICESIAD